MVSSSLAVDPMTLAYHELRSPLGLVAMTARAAADDCTDEALRRRCEAIERAAERLLRTTQKVLTLAAGAVEATPEAFSPADELTGIVADFQALGLPLDFRVEHRAYRAAAFTGRAGFEALIQSLICNALDHGVTGGAIEIHVDAVSNELLINISNESAAEKRHAGLGVGTYLCNRLAETLDVHLSNREDFGRHTATIAIPTTTTTLEN